MPDTTGSLTPARLSALERWGLRIFSDSEPAHASDLPSAIAQMRAVERIAILRAVVAGMASGLATAVAALLADSLLGEGEVVVLTADKLKYWAIVVGTTAVASAVEIAFLYWDGLRAARRIHALAQGLCSSTHDDEMHDAWKISLVRAALEIPNPRDPVFGIDPMRGASKPRLLIAAFVYKLKVGITSFLVKLVVKRLGGRIVARGWLEFFAIPVLGAWNGLVCSWYMREARMRALGPVYAKDFISFVSGAPAGGTPALDQTVGTLMARAIALTIVANRGVHTNLLLCLEQVRSWHDLQSVPDLDDEARFLTDLTKAWPDHQSVALTTLAVAAALDGQVSRAERRLIYAAQDACGVPRSLANVSAWEERLRAGLPSSCGALKATSTS